MNELIIKCKKLKDRIKEQNLAEKRGWCSGCYGIRDGIYYVHYTKKKLKKEGK